MSLEEVRRRSARLREIERREAEWERRPLLVRRIVAEYRILRFVVALRTRAIADRARAWWADAVRVRLAIRYVHLRESIRDRWLIARGRPLYFRCLYYTNVIRPCRGDATWTYVGPSSDGSPTPPPHHPIQCDACVLMDDPEVPDYMLRVGRWRRAPTYVRDVDARRAATRPEEEDRP